MVTINLTACTFCIRLLITFFLLLRTLTLIQSLEQSIVEGQHVVLSDVQLPFNPILLPLIEVGLYWNHLDKRELKLHISHGTLNTLFM